MMEIKALLDSLVLTYNRTEFIETDPISVPHAFSRKEDMEIAGFLSATLGWGNRKAILKSARQLMAWMDNQPFDFVMHASEQELKPLEKFVYRTFNGTDCLFFIHALRNIYSQHQGLEAVFTHGFRQNGEIKTAIGYFRYIFFSIPYPARTNKHVASPMEGSSAKRLNMFLRWMVRSDEQKIDFGLWKQIPMGALKIPLDVHSGSVARLLGLLNRKQNDWKAVELLTQKLREFDPEDPIKYDFALFGAGVNKLLR
jgi:uncharacterized protein (TIGR02757 family)